MENIEITIRNFQLNDYNAIVQLWKKSGLPFRAKGRDHLRKIENEIKKENAIFLVSVSKGKIIGTIFGTHDGRKGWINRLVVDPQYQKQNIGRKLVTAVEKCMSEIGIDIIACLIENNNAVSRKVFKQLGYIEHNDITYHSKRKDNDT